MDENTAWQCFSHTGNIRDYLVYAQCRAQSGAAASLQAEQQEDRHEDRHPGPGGFGEARG